MGEYKIKAIQRNSGTFRHNQTNPGIRQAHSGIFRTLCYRDIFKTVLYPEHIQNIFRTYSEPEAYLEPRHIPNPVIFRAPQLER